MRYSVMNLSHLAQDKMATILADDSLNCIFLNENNRIRIQIPLKFLPKSPIDNEPEQARVMALHGTGDTPLLPEQMLTQFTDAYMRQ